MKKQWTWIFCIVLMVAVVGFAGDRRVKAEKQINTSVAAPEASRAQAWIDYYDDSGVEFTWGGSFYMVNIFRPPVATWYPFSVIELSVFPGRLDSAYNTTGAGTINRVRVFGPSATVLAEESSIAGTARVWNNIPFTTPPVIAAGDFLAGIWNTSSGDGGFQGYANTAWVAPPDEPFLAVNGPTTSAATTGWATSAYGAGYGTVSAAIVRALVEGDTVPVELMSFSAE